MQKPPKATAMGWLGVFGLVMMLAMSSCESVAIEPASAETRPAVRVTSQADDVPDRPPKPPGE